MNTITIPHGYNGDTIDCFTVPIEIDGNLAKLRVANSSYLFMWVRLSEYPEVERPGRAEETSE